VLRCYPRGGHIWGGDACGVARVVRREKGRAGQPQRSFMAWQVGRWKEHTFKGAGAQRLGAGGRPEGRTAAIVAERPTCPSLKSSTPTSQGQWFRWEWFTNWVASAQFGAERRARTQSIFMGHVLDRHLFFYSVMLSNCQQVASATAPGGRNRRSSAVGHLIEGATSRQPRCRTLSLDVSHRSTGRLCWRGLPWRHHRKSERSFC